jgi:uncharacterized DUF497 family protein
MNLEPVSYDTGFLLDQHAQRAGWGVVGLIERDFVLHSCRIFSRFLHLRVVSCRRAAGQERETPIPLPHPWRSAFVTL